MSHVKRYLTPDLIEESSSYYFDNQPSFYHI